MRGLTKRASVDLKSHKKPKHKLIKSKKIRRNFSLEKFKYKPAIYWNSKRDSSKSSKRPSLMPGSTFSSSKDKWMLINGEMVPHNPISIT